MFLRKGSGMKHIAVIVALVSITTCFSSDDTLRNRANHVTEDLFGQNGLRVDDEEKDRIVGLLFNLYKVSPSDQRKIAEKTAQALSEVVIERQNALQTADEQEKVALEQSLFVMNHELVFLKKFAGDKKTLLTWRERFLGRARRFYYKTAHFFGIELAPSVDYVSAQLFDYLRFEREHIFGDYEKTAAYYRRLKIVPLPPLMKLWKDQTIVLSLLERIRKVGYNVKLSMADIADVAFEVLGAGEGATLDTLMEGAEEAASNFTSAMVDSLASDSLTVIGENGAETATTMADEVAGAVDAAVADAGEEAASQGLTELSADLKNAAAGKLPPEPAPPSEVLDGDAFEDLTGQKPGPEEPSGGEPEEKPGETVEEQQDGWLKRGAKKVWNGLKRTKNAIADGYDKYLAQPYKKYIYKNLEWVEDNALKKALDTMPTPLRMATDMGIQMSIMNGGGLVVYWADQSDQKAFNALVKKNQQNTESLKQAQAELTGKKMADMKLASTAFGQIIGSLSTAYQDLQNKQNLELLYLEHSMLQQQPQPYFVVDNSAVQMDQRFVLSTMYNIPEQYPHLAKTLPTLGAWHNIFRVGNWEFMNSGDLHGFYQVNAAPLTEQKNEGPSIPAQVLYNSIFAEYIPGDIPVSFYTVQVQTTINRITYPFFVGVIFNNARWISGVSDRYNQQRFSGFYGDSNKKVYAVTVESANSTPDQIKSKLPNVQSPFFRILNNPASYTKNPVTLDPEPATYTFTIQTAPTQVVFTFANGSSSQDSSTGTKITTSGLNSSVFNFHGIGLVSAGCAASFKILQPTEFNYTKTS